MTVTNIKLQNPRCAQTLSVILLFSDNRLKVKQCHITSGTKMTFEIYTKTIYSQNTTAYRFFYTH